nr:uncharacterized protein LOC109183154 [Ipomoea batatas]
MPRHRQSRRSPPNGQAPKSPDVRVERRSRGSSAVADCRLRERRAHHCQRPEHIARSEDSTKKKVASQLTGLANKGNAILSDNSQNLAGFPRALPPWAPHPSTKASFATPLTPLKVRPIEILAYAEECQLVKPSDQGYVAVPDHGKYYRRQYGHSTDECQA